MQEIQLMQGRSSPALNSAYIIVIVIHREKVQLVLRCVVARALTCVKAALAIISTARAFQMSGKSSVM